MEPIWKTLRADMETNASSFHYWQKDRYPLLLLRTDPLALCDTPISGEYPIYEKVEYKINKTQIQKEQQIKRYLLLLSFCYGRIWRNFCRGNCNVLRFSVFVDWNIGGKFSSTMWWNRALQPKVVWACSITFVFILIETLLHSPISYDTFSVFFICFFCISN